MLKMKSQFLRWWIPIKSIKRWLKELLSGSLDTITSSIPRQIPASQTFESQNFQPPIKILLHRANILNCTKTGNEQTENKLQLFCKQTLENQQIRCRFENVHQNF